MNAKFLEIALLHNWDSMQSEFEINSNDIQIKKNTDENRLFDGAYLLKILRDLESYNIKGIIKTKKPSKMNNKPGLKSVSEIIFSDSSSTTCVKYHHVATNYSKSYKEEKEDIEETIIINSIYKQYSEKETVCVKEFYINAPDNYYSYLGRARMLDISGTLKDPIGLIYIDSFEREGHRKLISCRYEKLKTDSCSFVVSEVLSGFVAGRKDCLYFQYLKTDNIPPHKEREEIAKYVSFFLGRPLIKIGETGYDCEGMPTYKIMYGGRNLIEFSKSRSYPPIELNNWREIFSSTIDNYLEKSSKYQLDLYIERIQRTFRTDSDIGVIMLHNATELIAKEYMSTNGKEPSYVNKKYYLELIGDELISIEKKLSENPEYAPIVEGIKRSYVMSVGEIYRKFQNGLGISVTKKEKKALDYRSKISHNVIDLDIHETLVNYGYLLNYAYKILLAFVNYGGKRIQYGEIEDLRK